MQRWAHNRSQASQKDPQDPTDFQKGAWQTMLKTLDLPPYCNRETLAVWSV